MSIILFVFLASSVTLTVSEVLIGSPGQVIAVLGADAVLPCRLDPMGSASPYTVDWRKLPAGPERRLEVHLYRNGTCDNGQQDSSYRDRTGLSDDGLSSGDLSLTLRGVKASDGGEYECVFLRTPPLQVTATVTLLVDAAPAPLTSIMGVNNSGVVLQCAAHRLSHPSEVEWLDSEGHVLPAGPTETVRDPDGTTTTVRRNVTVEKTATNRFTCRVIQRAINHRRETEIYVPEVLFPVECPMEKPNGIGIGIVIVIGIGILIATVAIPASVVRVLGYKISFTKINGEAVKKEPSQPEKAGERNGTPETGILLSAGV